MAFHQQRRIRQAIALAAAGFFAVAVTPLNAAIIIQRRGVEGEGAIYPIGSRAPGGLTVEVTDESGSPVSGASVSFRLPDQGPTGTFTGGLRTQVVTTKRMVGLRSGACSGTKFRGHSRFGSPPLRIRRAPGSSASSI